MGEGDYVLLEVSVTNDNTNTIEWNDSWDGDGSYSSGADIEVTAYKSDQSTTYIDPYVQDDGYDDVSGNDAVTLTADGTTIYLFIEGTGGGESGEFAIRID